MDKQTKMILGVAAIGVAAYLVFKSMKPKTTATFVNEGVPVRPRIRIPRPGRCGTVGGCVNNRCNYKVFGPTGNVQSVITHTCSGDGESMQIGPMVNA